MNDGIVETALAATVRAEATAAALESDNGRSVPERHECGESHDAMLVCLFADLDTNTMACVAMTSQD